MISRRYWKLPTRPLRTIVLVLFAWAIADAVAAQNLAGSLGVHDPSSIFEQDGTYYLFYTGTRIRTKTSTDLLNWAEGPRVFSTPPSWAQTAVPGNTNGNFWAPEIAYFNNLYHLYYSVSTFGSQVSAIGMATNPTLNRSDPDYAWTDHGAVIQSTNGSVFNTIDPSILHASNGDIWMTFGSFWNGIYSLQIDPATGMQKTRTPLHHLADNDSIEASYEYQRGNEYYLFVNWGACCEGVNSTYNIRVGRSSSPTGPFLDAGGVDMVSGGGTLFLGSEGRFIGPGQISIISQGTTEFFAYHYYDGNDNGTSKLNLRRILWNADGWPLAGAAFPVPEPASLALLIVSAAGMFRLARPLRHRAHPAPGYRYAICPACRYLIGTVFFAIAICVAAIGRAQTISGSLSIHDPSTITHLGSKYYDFYTGTGIQSKTSTDRIHWSNGPAVFATAPSWIAAAVPANSNRDYWAPEVAFFNDQYYLYYSVSTFGSQVSAIGLATNPTLDSTDPNYHWTDQGAVIQSHSGSTYNTIDPSIFQNTDGSMWMTFGSFWNGIYATQLDPSTGKRITANSPTIALAKNPQNPPDAIEASYLYKHDNYYYLFANWGNCCQGVNSTYNIRVGRSTSVMGPFLDQNGVSMSSGGGSLFLGTEGNFIGPGQIGIFHDSGVDWFSYHYYNGAANGAPTFNLRTLVWSSTDWPVPATSSLIAGDVNLDGVVDLSDFSVISDHMFQTATSRTDGDLSGDGMVNYDDFRSWKAVYSRLGGSSDISGIPEPTSCRLLVVGLISIVAKRRVSGLRTVPFPS